MNKKRVNRTRALRSGVIVWSVAVVAACAPSRAPITPITYEEYIARWESKSETQVVVAWGMPDQTHNSTDGGRVIEYRRAAGGVVACVTRFTMDSTGRVINWWYRGDDCRPPGF